MSKKNYFENLKNRRMLTMGYTLFPLSLFGVIISAFGNNKNVIVIGGCVLLLLIAVYFIYEGEKKH